MRYGLIFLLCSIVLLVSWAGLTQQAPVDNGSVVVVPPNPTMPVLQAEWDAQEQAHYVELSTLTQTFATAQARQANRVVTLTSQIETAQLHLQTLRLREQTVQAKIQQLETIRTERERARQQQLEQLEQLAALRRAQLESQIVTLRNTLTGVTE